MKNIEYIIYTYKHRKVLLKLAEKYLDNDENKEVYLKKLFLHDLDKMFMLLFYDKKSVSLIHRNTVNHHENNVEKSEFDYIEMVLDWESARYTKLDKPLNAYDTLYKYYPDMEGKILPILKRFSIDKSDMSMENDIIEYTKGFDNIDINTIKDEMKEYIEFLMQ